MPLFLPPFVFVVKRRWPPGKGGTGPQVTLECRERAGMCGGRKHLPCKDLGEQESSVGATRMLQEEPPELHRRLNRLAKASKVL